jgi:hypothetical protein
MSLQPVMEIAASMADNVAARRDSPAGQRDVRIHHRYSSKFEALPIPMKMDGPYP